MLRTTRILIPILAFSLTILGLATLYSSGCMEAQAGEGYRLKVSGVGAMCN